MGKQPPAQRRKLAMSELVMGVAWSFAVTEPEGEDGIRVKYGLTEDDMARLKDQIGARLEGWAERLGYADHWD